MADQSYPDLHPWGNYYFSLEINEVEVAHFMECSGLKTAATVFEIEEGGNNNFTHKRVSGSKWENIVLKRAISSSLELHAWRERFIQDGFSERTETSGAIVQRDNDGSQLRRYTFLKAWPVSWEGPALNSGGSELAIETLEIAHDGLLIDAKAPKPEPPPVKPPEKLETGPVQFEYDKDELTPDGQKTVDNVDKQLDDNKIEEIWVEGHTCNMGSHSYNQKLSQGRADTCADSLKQDGRTVHSSGYSYDHPVASNSTSAGRSKNRRTEFWQTPRAGKRAGEL